MSTSFPFTLFASQQDDLAHAIRKIAHATAKYPAQITHTSSAPRAYLVGGYVRDLILGIPSSDADMEIFGIPQDDLSVLLEKLFPGAVNLVGKSFGVYNVRVSGEYHLDIALPRTEHKVHSGHTGFTIESNPFLDPIHASRRRDFTINAISLDPLTGEILDPHHGVNDLKNGILRVVDPQTFVEDPLRAFRAIQLAARFELTPDEQSLDVLQDLVARGETETLSQERIGQEIKKLLVRAHKPSIGLSLAQDIGLIARHFPSLHILKNTIQDPEWHPEGDVWTHTLMVVDEAARLCRQTAFQLTENDKLQIIFGSLCHDLGKASTTQLIDGRVRSRGHEEAGSSLAAALATQLHFSHDIVHAATAIAADHLKPSILYAELHKGVLTEFAYGNAIRRVLRRIAPLHWKPFIIACEADWRGRAIQDRNITPYAAGIAFTKAIETNNLAHEALTPLVQGRDLLDLGLTPGPLHGEIIRAIEDMRDTGTIRTKEEALVEVKKMI